MAWYKEKYNDSFVYKLRDGSKTVYHQTQSLSESDLNDPERSFSLHYHNYFIAESVDSEEVRSELLPAGIYYVKDANEDYVKLEPFNPKIDGDLFEFTVNESLFHDFNVFLQSKAIYEKLGLVYKRGCLLFGPPGTGKTTSIQMVLNTYAPDNSLILYLKEPPSHQLLSELNADSRFKIIIFEELLDAIKHFALADMLRFLDGEISLNNTYIIASTNYPEKLPPNLTNRPGRFDLLSRVDFLSEQDRKKYISKFIPEVEEEFINQTKNLSIAQLKEILLQMFKDKITYQQAIQNIRTHEELSKSGFKKIESDDELDEGIL